MMRTEGCRGSLEALLSDLNIKKKYVADFDREDISLDDLLSLEPQDLDFLPTGPRRKLLNHIKSVKHPFSGGRYEGKRTGPLSGITVVDMTKFLAGPYCTMVLRDLGAKVIKIEQPVGDGVRLVGPFFNTGTNQKRSAYFQSVNRGKLSIVLDMKNSPEDKKIFEGLLEKADVLIENYRPGVLTRMGYPWEKLHKNYPHLIYGALSGFGQTGPYKNFGCFDIIVQAMAGVMSITGYPDKPPAKAGHFIGDIVPALYMAIAINSALYGRTVSRGIGSMIDVGMFDCQVAIMEHPLTEYIATEELPVRNGRGHTRVSPFHTYKTKDGYCAIAAWRPADFELFCDLIGASYMKTDERFSTNFARCSKENATLFQDLVDSQMSQKSTSEWLTIFQNHKIICGPLNTLDKVIADEHLQHRNMFVETLDEEIGNVRLVGNPMKHIGGDYEDSKTRPKAPGLDEHRSEILAFVQSSSKL